MAYRFFLLSPMFSEHSPLSWAFWNTTVSNGHYKAYALEHVVMKSSLQPWPQGQYSLHESQIWHPVLNYLQMHPTKQSLFSQYSWSPVTDKL
jgi:hypothetical protein